MLEIRLIDRRIARRAGRARGGSTARPPAGGGPTLAPRLVQMPILSRADLQFFEDNGYVVARGAISREQAARTAAEVWEFSGKDPSQPDTWRDPEKPGIMIEMYHGPNQWANRTAPGVHEAFAQ